MPLKQLEKVIDGNTYIVSTLDVDTGMDVLGVLVSCLGPSLGAIGQSLLSAGIDPADIKSGDPEARKKILSKLDLQAAFQMFATNYKTPEIKGVLHSLSEATTIDGPTTENHPIPMKEIYAIHFAGDFKGLFSWAMFALEVQFGNFLGDLMKGGVPMTPVKVASSPTTSLDAGLS